MLAAATMSMQTLHRRPEAIDIAVILSRTLPPFENRGFGAEFQWFNSVTLTANCNTWAGCGSYPWLTILALILISFSAGFVSRFYV
jgi:hypothetical protein